LGREANTQFASRFRFDSVAGTFVKLFACMTIAAVGVGAAASQTPAPSLSITTGLDFSSGDYGASEETQMTVAPIGARLKMGDWRLSATLPYLMIDGATAIVGGGGGPIIIDPDAPAEKRDGLGDLMLGAAFSALKEESAGFNLDIGAGIKLPTASEEDALGTGETDYSFSADFSKTFGNLIPFVTVGYRMPGDPATIDLNNTLSASIGTSVTIGESVAILSYDYREPTSDLVDESQEIFGAFSAPLGDINWTLYGSAGLTEGSPDFATGLMLTFNAF
jgi:hypothetical protein